MSLGEQAPLTPEAVPKGPAIEILKYVAELEVPEIKTLEDLQGFLIENEITQVLATAIELHGDLRSRYAVQPAIYEETKDGLFSAAIFPKALGEGETEASILHTYECSPERPVMGLTLPLNSDYSLDVNRPPMFSIGGHRELPREIAEAALYTAARMAVILEGKLSLDNEAEAQERMIQHFGAVDEDELTIDDIGRVEEMAA